MHRILNRITILLAATSLVFATAAPVAAAPPRFPDFIAFDAARGEFPEGVAVDKVGNVYVGFDAPRGEVRRYGPDGTESVLIDFGSPGILGLAIDAVGNVYVARYGAAQGVYRVDQSGHASLIPGTDAIVFPNALAFDKAGNLYVSESFSFDAPLAAYPGCDIGFGSSFGQGGIWRVAPGGRAELWLRHDLLTGLCLPSPIPFPVGANGIAFRHGAIYDTNTEKALVVRVPVAEGGQAGEPVVLAAIADAVPPSPFGPPAADGMALDVHGNIYVPIINQSRLVRVSADGATVETLATSADGLDFPASIAFGTGRGERQTAFVTNFAIGPPGGAGPGLLKIAVGTPGWPVP